MWQGSRTSANGRAAGLSTLFSLLGLAALGVAATAGARPDAGAVGALKLCAFTSGSDNSNAMTENIKVQAAGAAGHKGTMTIHGAGIDHTARFTMLKTGVALMSFPVSQSGAATITVKLTTAPVKTRTLHLMLSNSAGNETQAGCTPH